MKKLMLLCSFILLITSCKREEVKFSQAPVKKEKKKEVKNHLPFTHIELNDLSSFKPTGENWKIVEDVIADRKEKRKITSTKGTGILLNTNDAEKNKNLFTQFEHGDIELELDIMVPIQSNSGIYFQGRYEVQILDSWNVKKPKFSDMGGIYQRWDTNRPKGKEGYEGKSPRINASKAPGLWQHLKVIFHAAKFDKSGKKIKNAWFEEVWLNNVLIHERIEVTGPTRAAFFGNEKSRGPLMIQGDHGPVAFKNIKYKLYEGNKFKLSNILRSEYKSVTKSIKNLDSFPLIKSNKTKKFSLVDVTTKKDGKMLIYTGNLEVPKSGKYLFDVRNGGVSQLFLDNKLFLNMPSSNMRKINIKSIDLEKGTIPFKLIYNQNLPWQRGFTIEVEGPEMQKYSLQENADWMSKGFDPLKGIIIEPKDNKPVMQRSFVDHKGKKYMHCISVGTPKSIHYSYNLATGSLLKVWDGSFLNTTHMWLSRGYEQLGAPVGFMVSLHGDLEFAKLENENTLWPVPLPENKGFKQLGYELDATRMPTFSYEIDGSTITNSFTIPEGNRQVNRTITTSKANNLWYKIADGESIKSLPNDIYIVNNESYYIDFSANDDLSPIVRTIDGKDELIVKIPNGNNTINYSIIW